MTQRLDDHEHIDCRPPQAPCGRGSLAEPDQACWEINVGLFLEIDAIRRNAIGNSSDCSGISKSGTKKDPSLRVLYKCFKLSG